MGVWLAFTWLLRMELMRKQFDRVSQQTNGARIQGIAVPGPNHVICMDVHGVRGSAYGISAMACFHQSLFNQEA